MEQKESPLFYAASACDTVIRRFKPEELPPVYKLNYHHGVFFSGLLRTYLRTEREEYFAYIRARCEAQIDSAGNIRNEEDTEELDDLQPGIIFFYLYRRTGDMRYKWALDGLIRALKCWKRNPEGGFWHKSYFPNQMWLDGLYMAGPLAAEYAQEFQDRACLEIAISQIELMWEHTYDKRTGLLYHGWDASHKAEWADKKTGLSPEFWGRSIGWASVAIADVLLLVPREHPKRALLESYLGTLMTAVAKCQDETGLWYQVMDKGNRADNWTETSCSCLFVYSLLSAASMGIIPPAYAEYAKKGYAAVLNQTERGAEGELAINNVCVGTGIGSYEYYVSRPTGRGDLHGMGAFILMCVRMYDYLKEAEGKEALL